MTSSNGRGGPGERRIVVSPRAAQRARQRQLTDQDPLDAPPPSLLGDDDVPDAQIAPYRWRLDILRQRSLVDPPAEYPDDGPDPYQEGLRLRVRPNHRADRSARVRVYHRLEGAPEAGLEGRCWAFTITRIAYDRLVTERVLDSDGATYPNGTSVIPPRTDPLYVPLQCGSCGTQTVECLQMEFWQD